MASIPYSHNPVEITPAQVATWTLDGRTKTLSGTCPRCSHETRSGLVHSVQTYALVAPQDRDTQFIDCLCAQAHPGRRDSDPDGCGASWFITLTKHGETVTLGVGASTMRAAATARAELAVADALKSVQSMATKWLAGTTAISGLFALLGALLAANAVTSLDFGAKVAAGVAGALGLAAAAASIYCGYHAAYGWPKSTQTTINNDRELQTWYESRRAATIKRANTASKWLSGSVWSAFGSLAFLAIAVGVLWLGPPATPAASVVTVTYGPNSVATTSASVCGSLVSFNVSTTVIAVTDGPQTKQMTIVTPSITKIVPTVAC